MADLKRLPVFTAECCERCRQFMPMTSITRFFRCFGCGREHTLHGDAASCCAVVQEIWRCRCGEEFPTPAMASRHLEESDHKFVERDIATIAAQPQAFASGWMNFSTP